MSSSGVRLARPDPTLVARARAFLEPGPAATVALIEHVLRLPNAPPAIADHLARALLQSEPGFVREPEGVWRLDYSPSSVSTTLAGAAARLDALSYAVVDVETTGSRSTGDDRITEIAAVIVRNGELADRFCTLVNPQRAIPPYVTALTRITWEMVRDKPVFRDVADQVGTVLAGHVFVAHNVGFDWRFVSGELERSNGGVLEGRRLCTVRLTKALLPHLPRRSLDAVANFFGIEIVNRHRAGGDAEATAKLLVRLLGVAGERGCETWDDLARLLAKRAKARRRRRRALPYFVDRDPTL